MAPSRSNECPVCYATFGQGRRYCPRCNSPLSPSAVVEASQAKPPSEPQLSVSEISRVERAFRERFEKHGVYIGEARLKQARSILLDTERQLRRASVLFFDLCHSASLARRIGAERMGQILEQYSNICVRTIYRHHGFVVKFIGDAVLAIFGAPLAYDRDAESSVRAAMDLREAVVRLGTELGYRLDGHASIATGEVLSAVAERGGAREYDVTGNAVNLAARLQAQARAGEILVCQATALAVSGVFECEQTRPMRLKNVSNRYVASRVLGEKAGGAERHPIQTEFVGRVSEVERIHEALRCAQRCSAQLLVITGEPGVGKSRLVAEALRAFEPQPRILRCECVPHGKDTLLYPLIELLRALCGIDPRDSHANTRQKAEHFCRTSNFDAAIRQAIGYLLGFQEAIEAMASLPYSTVRQEVFQALATVMLSSPSGQLTVVCFDDAQWMDTFTGEWLAQFTRSALKTPLAVILIHRLHEKIDADLPEAHLTIRVNPLPQWHRVELLRQIIGELDADKEMRDMILSRTGGNPLFVEETARFLVQLARTRPKLTAADLHAILDTTVPQSLHSVIQYRIDSLNRRTRLVLQCGAVLGQRFSFGILSLFEAIKQNLVEQLAVLRGLRFLEEYPPPPELEYAFLHPLARDVAYQNLPEEQKRILHGKIAEQMEIYLDKRIPEYYGTLAYHFERANNVAKALYYAIKSGERAVGLAANREALQHFERALYLLEHSGNGTARRIRECRLLCVIGRLRRILGDVTGGMQALDRALRLSVELSNQHLESESAYELAAARQVTGEYDRAEQFAVRALKLAHNQRRRALEAQLHNILGMIAWGRSRFDEALVCYGKVFGLGLEDEAPSVLADAHNNAGLIHWQQGRYEQALAEMHQCSELAGRMGDRFRIAATVMNMGIIQERLGRFRAACRSYENALELSERIGFRQGACAALANLSNLCLVKRKPREALDYAARSQQVAHDIGDRRSEAIAEENMGLACLLTRDFDSALGHFSRAMRLARAIGDLERQVSVGLAKIELDLERPGKPVSAQRIRSLVRMVEAHRFRDYMPRALRNLGRVLSSNRKSRAEGETTLRRALAEAQQLSNMPEQIACRRCLEDAKMKP